MQNDIKDLLLLQQKHFFYSTTIRLIIAGLMCVGGFILLVLGITGAVEIVVDAVDVKGKIANASPGLVFVFLGMFIIIKTHHKTMQNLEQNSQGTLTRAGLNVTHGLEISGTSLHPHQARLSKETIEEVFNSESTSSNRSSGTLNGAP